VLGRVFKFVLISAAVLILIGLFVPNPIICGENAKRSSQRNDLRQISLALKQYAMDHKDRYPESLSKLKDGYLPSDFLLRQNCLYFPPMGDPEWILLAEAHSTDGKRSIVKIGGETLLMSDEVYQSTIDKQRRYRTETR
jgi:hypothetical protein